MLSRAFRNRFVELHFDELPSKELENILHQRCSLPPSYCTKLVNVMEDLQVTEHFKASHLFQGSTIKVGLIRVLLSIFTKLFFVNIDPVATAAAGVSKRETEFLANIKCIFFILRWILPDVPLQQNDL